MCKIDSHQHFWQFDPIRDEWITDKMYILQNDFLPAGIEPILHHYGIDGCIAVQADQSETESAFLLDQANRYGFIKGVVGWVDLLANDVEERLAYYAQFDKMKGFRHILQAEQDKAFMLNPLFKRGIAKLAKYNFTYDILITDDQLPHLPDFIAAFPNQPFVIDHLAKPRIKEKKISEWENDIRNISVYENVFCKVSGMVTEADWMDWKKGDFRPYLDVVFESFGTTRVMYGSDWPVCRLAATYGDVLAIAKDYTSIFSADEQRLFWGGNATKFYNLNDN